MMFRHINSASEQGFSLRMMALLLTATVGAGGLSSARADPADGNDPVAKILARPLFSPSRRPAHDPETPVTATPVLTGMTREGTALTALLRLPDQPKVFRAREGQNFSGWEVTALSATSATLERDGQSVTLHLDFRHAPPP